MQFPLAWLKQWIPLTHSPQEIAQFLTQLGIEVDSIEEKTPSYKGVVVGQVLDVKPHPQAERLSIAQVSDGKQDWTVVCGAPNCRAGMRTAFAPLGAVLTDAEGKKWTIRKAKLRGEESFGMLCTAAELHWSDDHEELIEFGKEFEVGTDLSQDRSDTFFSVSLTPNLGHAMSIRGIARELSAISGIPLNPVSSELVEEGPPIEKQAKVSVADHTLCPRYACRFLQGVQIGPSPDWLVRSLQGAGLRSINNVVDATNFVMLERGHPLHAFDADRIADAHIVVRQAYEGEAFTTLDGQEHTLTEEMLVISDPNRALAIAGVMGGENSEVGDETQNILLESAYFQPQSIRRTSKHLGISTDSSRRFERGTDPNAVLDALDRAAALIQEVAGGTVSKGAIDCKKGAFSERMITLRLPRLNQLLGLSFSAQDAKSMLERLSLETEIEDDTLNVTIPTYRNDLSDEVDLIEEIARLNGFQNIPKSGGYYQSSRMPHSVEFLFSRTLRDHAVSLGLQEWLTCDLIGPTLLKAVPTHTQSEDARLQVINPTSVEQSILRTSLLQGMMDVCRRNIDHQNRDLQAFEIGRIHYQEGENVREPQRLGILLTGQRFPHQWDRKSEQVDFYDLKGIVEALCENLGLPRFKCINTEIPELHSGRQATLLVNSQEIGWMGELHPSILRALDIDQRVYFAELFTPELQKLQKSEWLLAPIAIYPSSERDWTTTLGVDVPIASIIDQFFQIPSRILESVTLLDLYQNEKLGTNQHNATFRFVYRDREKTVEQEEVENEHRRLIAVATDWIQKEHQHNP